MFQGDLFNSSNITDWLDGQASMTKRRVNAIDSLEQLESETAAILQGAQVEVCRIHRDEADFDVSETSGGNAVTLALPVTGNHRLLSVKPPGFPRPGPYATRYERRWASDGELPRIELSESFGSDGDRTRVRQWAKEQTDLIEAKLAAMLPTIDEYNQAIQARTQSWIDERRRTLENASDLRDDLGRGI